MNSEALPHRLSTIGYWLSLGNRRAYSKLSSARLMYWLTLA